MNQALRFVMWSCLALKGFTLSLKNFPNPMTDPATCGRPGVAHSVICDADDILTKKEKDAIEGRVMEAEKNGRVQFGVAILNTMHVLESRIDEEAKKYATSLHDSWGVGDKESNNGVFIFLAIEDRAVYISTGKGLTNKLTNSVILSVKEHMKPHLRNKKYGEAIEAAVLEIELVIQNKDSKRSFFVDYWPHALFAIIFGTFVLYGLHEKREEEKMKKGRDMLEKLMHEVNESKDNKFQFESCPICLETFSQQRDAADMERLADNSHISDPDDLLSTQDGYTSSSQYKEVKSLIPGHGTNLAAKSTDGKRPMTLHCGHAFCHCCLKEYLSGANRNTVCPICRAPVDPDTPVATRPFPRSFPYGSPSDSQSQHSDARSDDNSNPSCHNHQNAQYRYQGYRRDSLLDMEILYRLSRLHYYYPRVVTSHNLDEMRNAVEAGNTEAFVRAAQIRHSEVEQTLRDIQARRNAVAKGSGGSSRSSFGGGSSMGGGGGGGRW